MSGNEMKIKKKKGNKKKEKYIVKISNERKKETNGNEKKMKECKKTKQKNIQNYS